MKKRDMYIETMLREADEPTPDTAPTPAPNTEAEPGTGDVPEIAIYYADLTDEARKKVLDSLDKEDELLNISGDEKSKQSVEDNLFGNNGKKAVPLFKIDATKLRSSMEI